MTSQHCVTSSHEVIYAFSTPSRWSTFSLNMVSSRHGSLASMLNLSQLIAGFRRAASCSTIRWQTSVVTHRLWRSDRDRRRMYKYIAMIWNPEDRCALDRAAQLCDQVADSLPEWSCRLQAPGTAVFDLSSEQGGLTAYVLPKQAGVIFGRLFSLDASVQSPIDVTGIVERTALLFASTSGRHLVENFWGSYVAILRDWVSGKRLVIRDCSGKIPCYTTSADGIDVVFSDVQDLDRLSIGPFSINWEYVAAFLTSSQMQIRASGIAQISEVLAGECVEFNMNSRRQFALWNPALISTEGIVYDHAAALPLLRDSVQQCIGSWARVHRSILADLSGGFDSAVVLGCLSRTPDRPAITCANRYGESPQEDERNYARMAAKKAAVKILIEFNPGHRSVARS